MPDIQNAQPAQAWSPSGVPAQAVPLQAVPAQPVPLQAVWQRPGDGFRIGLVNNMHGAGFRDADRQFRAILDAAGHEGGADVSVMGYCASPASGDAAAYRYNPIAAINDDCPDGLIITGAEPHTGDLRDEAYYPAMTRLIDHAIGRRIPVIFSCLATHIAVLHMSGVARRRLGQKRHGVLPFVVRGAHPLMRGTARRIAVPHSRWNDLDEAALAAAGYQVLAASSRGGVDRFVHDDAPGCVFLQGHPEYESASLALEYRRDVRRYLTGESPRYPTMPYGCFDAPTRSRMVALQRAVRHQRDVTVLEAFPVPMHQAAPWRDGAVRLYRNWLDAMALAQRLAVADA